MKALWLSSPRATFCIEVDEDGLITKTAPICWQWRKKFVGDLIEAFHIDRVEELDESSDNRLGTV